MKKNLLIISKNVFTNYDYERFKIEKLKKNFDISYLDCSSLFYNKRIQKKISDKNYHTAKNLFDFFKTIKDNKPDLIFDLLGFSFSYKTSFLRLFANFSALCIFFSIGPRQRISSIGNINQFFKIIFFSPVKFLIILNNFLTKKMFIKFIFYNSIILIGSKYREQMIRNIKSNKIIFYHSNDYDNYLRGVNKKIPFLKKKYGVFIDENVPDHSDYQITNYKSPIQARKYYDLMNNFFENYEKKFNLSIVIAIHPKSNISQMRKNFLNRRIIKNNTMGLIHNAKIVFTHCSTARSYAVLYKKPIICLTSNIISKTWFGDEILVNSKLTGSKLINLDNYKLKKLSSVKINLNRYKEYEVNFLKHPNSKRILFEDIIKQIGN